MCSMEPVWLSFDSLSMRRVTVITVEPCGIPLIMQLRSELSLESYKNSLSICQADGISGLARLGCRGPSIGLNPPCAELLAMVS